MQIRKFGMLFLLLAIVACAGDSDNKDKDADKADKHKPKPVTVEEETKDLICPQVAILSKAQEAFDYGGEAPDAAQLVAKARMKSIEGDCGYRKDGIDISFTVHMVASRGPRLGGRQASFPYFIAVVDPAENILSRQIITAQFKFSGTDQIATNDEPLHVLIPMSENALQVGPDYRVLVGYRQSLDGNKE